MTGTLPITRHWLDDDFDQLFSQREKEGAIFAVFSGLTLGIACLGLFGLSAFAVRRDAKQIGLRRVFGASSSSIVAWELVRFSGLIVLACAIAWPAAGYFLHLWLQGFVHRIELSPLIFISVGLGAIAIAWATIIGHVVYAARLKPIDVLRYE
jgi:putative ABC transport system permease protein